MPFRIHQNTSFQAKNSTSFWEGVLAPILAPPQTSVLDSPLRLQNSSQVYDYAANEHTEDMVFTILI